MMTKQRGQWCRCAARNKRDVPGFDTLQTQGSQKEEFWGVLVLSPAL